MGARVFLVPHRPCSTLIVPCLAKMRAHEEASSDSDLRGSGEDQPGHFRHRGRNRWSNDLEETCQLQQQVAIAALHEFGTLGDTLLAKNRDRDLPIGFSGKTFIQRHQSVAQSFVAAEW
jgi:hypothetical protein